MDLDGTLSEYGLSKDEVTDIDRQIFRQRAKPPALYTGLVIVVHLFPAVILYPSLILNIDLLHTSVLGYADASVLAFLALVSSNLFKNKRTVKGYPLYLSVLLLIVLVEIPMLYAAISVLSNGVPPNFPLPSKLHIGIGITGLASLKAGYNLLK